MVVSLHMSDVGGMRMNVFDFHGRLIEDHQLFGL